MTPPARRPCAGCPFARHSTPGKTGGSDATVFAGQAAGPFQLNCHSAPGYAQRPDPTLSMRPCAGAAIYRANTGVADQMPPSLAALPADPEAVFASAEELVAHHRKITPAEAAGVVRDAGGVDGLLYAELRRAGVVMIRRTP